MKYKLKTIKDIFDKIPANRIEDCMEEITTLLLQCKGAQGAMRATAEAISGNLNAVNCYFPEVLEWVDDGKGEIETNVKLKTENGTDIGSYKISSQ